MIIDNVYKWVFGQSVIKFYACIYYRANKTEIDTNIFTYVGSKATQKDC